ncbi:hypothetical protein GCM10027590_04440 [Nocardiopsis nanhaiensis]
MKARIRVTDAAKTRVGGLPEVRGGPPVPDGVVLGMVFSVSEADCGPRWWRGGRAARGNSGLVGCASGAADQSRRHSWGMPLLSKKPPAL